MHGGGRVLGCVSFRGQTDTWSLVLEVFACLSPRGSGSSCEGVVRKSEFQRWVNVRGGPTCSVPGSRVCVRACVCTERRGQALG
jgi:hypothetical protein